jgi:hypothetical protein
MSAHEPVPGVPSLSGMVHHTLAQVQRLTRLVEVMQRRIDRLEECLRGDGK